MKINKTQVFNFEGAFRGMRNPLDSWSKSDSSFAPDLLLGKNDLKLAKQLIEGGPEHRKFLRQILVCTDIEAPLYWWKEFDTYKIATVVNSTSTMHKLTSKEITINNFELNDYSPTHADDSFIKNILISYLENLRKNYIATKDKKYWKELVRWLPNGWLQTRTWTGNYENLRTMYFQRKNHKLSEWREFCSWIETLPYFNELINTMN